MAVVVSPKVNAQQSKWDRPFALIHHSEGQQKHSLIAGLEVLQQLFGLAAVGSKVAGKNVHIISGTDGLFLLLHLHTVQIGDFPFDRFDGLDLIDGLDVHGNHKTGFHIEKICQHPVIEFRSQNLQEADRPHFSSHTETVSGFELKGTWGNEILDRQSGGSQPVPGEVERLRLVHMEDIVYQAQTLLSVQRFCRNPQPLEVVENIRFNALQPGLCGFQSIRLDTYSPFV